MKRPETVLELLVNTKEVLETFGWARGVWQAPTAGKNGKRAVCLAGAMYLATVNEGVEYVEEARNGLSGYHPLKGVTKDERIRLRTLLDEAAGILTSMMRNEYGETLDSSVESIPSWNDRHNRQRYEVMRKLDKAIEKAQKLEMEAKGVEVVTA